MTTSLLWLCLTASSFIVFPYCEVVKLSLTILPRTPLSVPSYAPASSFLFTYPPPSYDKVHFFVAKVEYSFSELNLRNTLPHGPKDCKANTAEKEQYFYNP